MWTQFFGSTGSHWVNVKTAIFNFQYHWKVDETSSNLDKTLFICLSFFYLLTVLRFFIYFTHTTSYLVISFTIEQILETMEKSGTKMNPNMLKRFRLFVIIENVFEALRFIFNLLTNIFKTILINLLCVWILYFYVKISLHTKLYQTMKLRVDSVDFFKEKNQIRTKKLCWLSNWINLGWDLPQSQILNDPRFSILQTNLFLTIKPSQRKTLTDAITLLIF